MTDEILKPLFKASPVIDFQLIVASERPDAPSSYRVIDLGGAWVAAAPQFHCTTLQDTAGRRLGALIGIAYSEFEEDFIKGGDVALPVEVGSLDDLEVKVLPRLAGSFVLVTAGALPHRLYPDHAGSIAMVYLPEARSAASSPAMLLEEADYRDRFESELHDTMVVREGGGGWVPGAMTVHRGVRRLLPNHVLDLETWNATRFWPKPGEFADWREMSAAASSAAEAIRKFSDRVCRTYDVGVTLTAGFDTRLVLASCRDHLATCRFFTIAAPAAEMDMAIGSEIAQRFGFKHEILPLKPADAVQMATWDRMAGDGMMEAPRLTHPTLRELTDRNALLTGLFGEIGRCRYYRQDLMEINDSTIDARFVIDRLTVPAHPRVVESIDAWLAELRGQPNSVILDLSLLELKLGCWAMPQRAMTSSVKWAFMPFTQRAVFDAFIGVAPADKGTKALFWAIIKNLWPELAAMPINKYGDARDYSVLWKKLTNPVRVRRFLRDRLAKKSRAGAS
jgi:hypothetical protein